MCSCHWGMFHEGKVLPEICVFRCTWVQVHPVVSRVEALIYHCMDEFSWVDPLGTLASGYFGGFLRTP